jgi:hypothetical protein
MNAILLRAGRSGRGRMSTGDFSPVYGEPDEFRLPFHPSRSTQFVAQALGIARGQGRGAAPRRLRRLRVLRQHDWPRIDTTTKSG